LYKCSCINTDRTIRTPKAPATLAKIAWEGDSLDVLREFPKLVKMDFGAQLRLLQWGELPKDFKKMNGMGSGVFELREQDASHWYRVIYLTRIEDTIHVLHSFRKKSGKTSKQDIETAKVRLKNVRKRISR